MGFVGVVDISAHSKVSREKVKLLLGIRSTNSLHPAHERFYRWRQTATKINNRKTPQETCSCGKPSIVCRSPPM